MRQVVAAAAVVALIGAAVAHLRRKRSWDGRSSRRRAGGALTAFGDGFLVATASGDLAQGKDGRLLIWNDDGQVVSLDLAAPAPAR